VGTLENKFDTDVNKPNKAHHKKQQSPPPIRPQMMPTARNDICWLSPFDLAECIT
jgi:hypothetical protein